MAPHSIGVASDPHGPGFTLGDKLRVLRASLGWTIARCAAEARTEPEIWGRWEDDQALPLERNVRWLLSGTHLDERAVDQLLVHLPGEAPNVEVPRPRRTLTLGRGVVRTELPTCVIGGAVLELEPVARVRLLRSGHALLAPGVRRVGVYLRADDGRVLLLPAGPEDGRATTRAIATSGTVAVGQIGERLAAAGWPPGTYAAAGAPGGGVAIERGGWVGDVRRWTRREVAS